MIGSMGHLINNEDTILFFGDSITDCGRRDGYPPYGNGYVRNFYDMAAVYQPENKVTVINKGISGNTVEDLNNRWKDDVLQHQPEWLTILIGINDIHRYILEKNCGHLDPAGFEQVYEDLLQKTADRIPDSRIILIDPFYICRYDDADDFDTQVIELISEYIEAVQRLSDKYKAIHIRMHDIFQSMLKFRDPSTYCPEPVHPNHTGHFLIADSLYKVTGR